MFDFHSRTDETFLSLTTDEELGDAIRRSDDEPVVLFKHSATCPISSGANQRLTKMAEASELPIYRLVVQESRALSDAIEEQFGVRHESPQVLVLVNGAVTFHTSHSSITVPRLREAVQPSDA
ncbi:MAG: bacillithiol system redox-active protein YtxJ [Bacteroidota bacterium]